MSTYVFKRGQTFELSGEINIVEQGQPVLDLTGWTGRSQIRKPNGELIADLTFTWIDVSKRLCNIKYEGSTTDWPIGQAKTDILLIKPNGETVSTKTEFLEIEKEVTRAPA